MTETAIAIARFLAKFERDDIRESVREGEAERRALVRRFPLKAWEKLPLERYAYGVGNSRETFSWALENGTKKLALLANHGSQGFKIYFRKKDERWWYENEGEYKSEQDAWYAIRLMYLRAFALASAGNWSQIDKLHTSRHGVNALLKALVCYFPNELLPITSTSHIAHFLKALGVVEFDGSAQNIVNLNRLLLFKLRRAGDFEGWKTSELVRFLYAWAPPPKDGEGDGNGFDDESEAAASVEVAIKNVGEGGQYATETWSKIYAQISYSLEHKGQVILVGPPGTGKTFTAENFAKRWLSGEAGVVASSTSASVSASAEVSDDGNFGFTAISWLVVSNFQNHSWDKLFDEGKQIFRGGKLKGNFKEAQRGDIVFGYTGAPKLRIEAVASVNRPMFMDEDGLHCIELVPLMRVKRGVTFGDFKKNASLKKSEPMQSNMRGTLFKLTPKETEVLVHLSMDKDPDITEILELMDGSIPGKVKTFGGTNTGGGGGGDKLIRLTFHPSYSYEDFVEGFRPDATVSNNLVLRLKDGIFKRICREADKNRKLRYLILIDEINRANVAKVFGEVITVIEKDKRDLLVELPQSNEQFRVPPNVFIIGTMNTSDRSIKLFDIALRRRFSFIAMQPDAQLLAGAQVEGLKLDALLVYLNAKLVASGNRDKQIGHSFFMEKGAVIGDVGSFARAFREDVLPLLQEYCYDRFSDLANFVGMELVDVERACLVDSVINDDARLVGALAKVVASAARNA